MRAQLFLLCLLSFATGVMADNANTDLVEKRLAAEQKSYKNSFVLVPYKINYLLPLTYQARPNEEPYLNANTDLQHAEVKFQVSFKIPVTRKTLFKDNGYLYVAYTAQSLWQAFNSKESSPFRDTNHEPEIMLSFLNKGEWRAISMPVINVGFSHQSNGQSDTFSRSWNRLYLDMTFHYEDWYWNIKPWWRVPEHQKHSILDSTGDDNPDIQKYYGHCELRAFKQFNQSDISIMLRNNLENIHYGAVEINYSYPINKQVQGYVQIFNGYGETLIDYNHRNTRIGFGFMFNNWL